MPRIRSKLSVSIAKQTLDVIEDLMRKKLAKTTSEAVDILANNYLLTQGFGHSSASSDIIEELQSSKHIIIKDMEAVLDDLIAAKVEMKMAEVQANATHEEPKPLMPLDELLEECTETDAAGIERWANENAVLIGSTGNTVDDFVAAKVMMLHSRQAARAKLPTKTPVQTAPKETDAEKFERLLREGMRQYWYAYTSNQSLKLPAAIFHVARAAQGIKGVVGKIDNGGKEEYLLSLVDRLRDDATNRKWDVDAYLKEFKTIYDKADTIVENQNR